MNLRQKRDLRRLTRQIIQIIFFLWMPALYTSAFSGVRYVIEQIRAGKPIEQNAFLVMLIALCGFTILFGRFFCGYACAFGTLGDGMYALSQWVQKIKKKLPWVSEEIGRKLQKMKYIVLLVLMLIYALGFTKSSIEPVHGKYFLCCTQVRFQMPVTSPDGSSLYLYWWVCALKKDFSANIYVRWEQSLHGYRYCRFPFSIETEVIAFKVPCM